MAGALGGKLINCSDNARNYNARNARSELFRAAFRKKAISTYLSYLIFFDHNLVKKIKVEILPKNILTLQGAFNSIPTQPKYNFKWDVQLDKQQRRNW